MERSRQLEKQVDGLSKDLRELEETIQEKNWTTELFCNSLVARKADTGFVRVVWGNGIKAGRLFAPSFCIEFS